MKRIKLILLLVLLASIFTACSERDLGLSSSAAPKAESSSQSQVPALSEPVPVSSGEATSQTLANSAERYADILRGGTYYIDCNAVIEMEGMQLENGMLIAVEDGNSSISVSSDLSGALVTIRTLVFDGNVYQINDAQRSYQQIEPEQSANSFDTDFSALRYVGEGSGTFLDETRPCWEYERSGQTVRFFLNGGALMGMTQSITDEQASEITLKINALSANVPGQLVQMPIGYTKEQ